MQPAFSVIFFTTLVGAGARVCSWPCTAPSSAVWRWRCRRQAASSSCATASAVALLLTGLGLLASFFHLGHPERAWRTAAMWRTSWLSREVIALPVFMLGLFLYGARALVWR